MTSSSVSLLSVAGVVRGVSGDAAGFVGDCATVVEDCLLVEFAAELVVESSAISMALHVWRVASGANDTLRLASDFRLAALRSSMAFFSAWRLRSASSSRPRSSVLAPSFAGVRRAIGLNGSKASSVPENELSPPLCLLGPGVEKSMRSSSAFGLAGDFPLPVLRFRSSSKVGIAFGGVRGIAGLRMDLIWNGVEICLLSVRMK